MNFIIHFLLFSSLSILTGESSPTDEIEKNVQTIFEDGEATFRAHVLKLSEGGLLGKTRRSLVWKGTYKDQTDVAIKINSDKNTFDYEMNGLKALNATDDIDIESRGIPRIYFGGEFMHQYNAIAMTLFDETLRDRLKKQRKQGKYISELSILLIFKRTVRILKYLNEKKVIHNDIKPENIFLRGSDVFLGDFNSAAWEDIDTRGHTKSFASSNFYQKKARVPMDDLESLVYTLWYVAGIQWDRFTFDLKIPKPEGEALAKWKKNGTAEKRMTKKCMQFKDPNVQEAFRLICAEEMLQKKRVPDYILIDIILTDAIVKVHGNAGTPQFEWLTGESSTTA